MKQKLIKLTVLLFLIILIKACNKDNPIQIVPENFCWEIDNWEGLLSDSFLLTQEEPLIPNVDPLFINWLNDKDNRIDIRSLTSENFEDLKCLKQYLNGKSIVQLGESSHGTKEYNLIKTRLIKFLHKEMGFDVISFESGLFECFFTNENISEYTAEQAIKNSIFDEWWTNEVLESFEYIKQTQSTEHPLILCGFDCQTSGYNPNKRSDELFEMLSKVDSIFAEEAFTFDNYILTYRINNTNYLSFHEESIMAQYLEIISFFDQNIEELIAFYPDKKYYPVFIKQSIYSTIAFIKQKIAIAENNWGESFFIRDSAMAKNVSFLKEELFPDKKIILWAHNYHIEHNIDDPIHTTNMGSWLIEKYRDDLYTIGLYMLRGETTSGKNIEIIDVELPSTSNSLEAILYHLRKIHLFIDVLIHPYNDGNKWMYHTISTKISGYVDEEMIIKNEYDGIIFIDTSSVPDYL